MILKKIFCFITEEIWEVEEEGLTRSKKIALQGLRIILLAGHGFKNDLCLLRSSALTLYSLLSIVPIIAMLFGIAKGFGFENTLKQELLEKIPDQETLVLRLIEFAENMLANTEGGLIAGIGVITLFWSVIQVISNIEASFNHIWNIKKNREWARKLSDYLSLMLLAPVLLITSSSISVFVTTKIIDLIERTHLPQQGAAPMLSLLNYSPAVIMSILFSFMFIFMPNQKIEMKAGIIAGVMTGIFYQIVQWGYLELQLGVSNYNAIYGSFTALPLFLIWLQLGWIIVLFGCEVSFFIQHYSVYQYNQKYRSLSFQLRKIIGLRMMQLIIKRFIHAETALTISEISFQLALPPTVVQSNLAALMDSHLIVELKALSNSEAMFQPAKDIHDLTLYEVMSALEKQGENQLPSMNGFTRLIEINTLFNAKIEQSPENYCLKDI